ncbi:hypothetical protein ACF1BS_03730 [Streptomyces sp. NPDC014748]|uniref:hypothetical protein n=1 Tax=Streptomyces sp. NPDC014748 TaxID=3364905 RepID=UPI0036F69728
MPTRSPRTASVTQLETFYTVKQAAKRLIPTDQDPDNPDGNDEAGERWLRDGVNHKGWPCHRFGRRLMFSDSDLAEIAAMHRNAPTRAGRPRRKPARAAA